MMIPNIGVSASTSSGAQGSQFGDFNFTGGGGGSYGGSGAGIGGGQYGWLVWLGLAALVVVGLALWWRKGK